MKKVSVLTVCAAIFLLSMCLAVFCACDRAPACPEIPDEIEERGDFPSVLLRKDIISSVSMSRANKES